jgi:hypothetical protein
MEACLQCTVVPSDNQIALTRVPNTRLHFIGNVIITQNPALITALLGDQYQIHHAVIIRLSDKRHVRVPATLDVTQAESRTLINVAYKELFSEHHQTEFVIRRMCRPDTNCAQVFIRYFVPDNI